MRNYTLKLTLDPQIDLQALFTILEGIHGNSLSKIDFTQFRIENSHYSINHYYFDQTIALEINDFTYIYHYSTYELYISYQGNKYIGCQLVNYLLLNDLIEDDHGLSYMYDPIVSRKQETDFVTLKKNQYDSPIVYIPANTINPDKINSKLRGLAHIIYGLTKESTTKVQVILPGGRSISFDNSYKDITNFVIDYLNHIDYGDSFNQAKLLLNHLDHLDLSEMSQTDKLIEAMESQEKTASQEKLKLENEIAMLKEEINEYQEIINYTKENFNGFPLLYKGAEKDIYEEEQHDMIIAILEETYAKMQNKDSHEANMIQELLHSNFRKGSYHYKRNELRRICKQYRDINSQMERELNALGFELQINTSTNHHRIYFQNEYRYYSEFSSTASDKHSLDATRRDIVNRYLF